MQNPTLTMTTWIQHSKYSSIVPNRYSSVSEKGKIIIHYISRWYTGVSRRSVWQSDGRLVCWWNVVSQIPPSVFESSKWNLLHKSPRTCRCEWHNLCVAQLKGSRVMPLFTKFLYTCTLSSCDKAWIGNKLATINDSSSLK